MTRALRCSPFCSLQLGDDPRRADVSSARRPRGASGSVGSHPRRRGGRPQPRTPVDAQTPAACPPIFVADVLDIGEGRLPRERWMLLQPDDVRESYIEQVLLQVA